MKKINSEEFLKKTSETIFSTGFEEIDECLKNVEKGSIITIGARPSMGKTSFALSILNNLLEKDKKVFYFSPSTTMNGIIKKLISNKYNLYPYELEKMPDYKEKSAKYLDFLAKKDLFINNLVNLTVEDIENEIEEDTPDVVFIDYIQLLKMPKAPNFTDSINIAVQEIKRIAQDTGVIFVLLSQLSRAVEQRLDKRPLLSDIRNSSLLEEISDIVIMLYRDSYYNSDNIENQYQAEIIFRKNEFGPLALITLAYTHGGFKNITRVEF